ncbi:MAG: hypothetical protein ACYC9M_00065 [Desulfobulbaceae bacterium]
MELSAVIFPDTVLSERLCIPLVPVFAPLVYLQPVENDPDSGQAHSTILDDLLRRSFCTVQVPAPLGEDRERFLRLVSDLRSRRDDYAAQLGHLTLAGISSASRKKTETKSSIVGSLLAGYGIKNEGRDRRKMLLWQSRLLLKMAEMHGADQEELRRQVRRIREKEQGMLAGLRDEAELPFGLPGSLADVGMDSATLRQQRKAWARLLVLGEAEPETRIFISSDRDSVDLLIEEFEKRTGTPPVHLGQIALPARYPDPDGFGEKVRQFREEGAELLALLQERLNGQTVLNSTGGFSGEEQDAWDALLERFFPAAQYGRASLLLYACLNCSALQLFAGAFAPEERKFLPASESGTGFVLGVLEQVIG